MCFIFDISRVNRPLILVCRITGVLPLPSRGHLKSEYEEKLRKELEEISRKTSAEIDKIKSNAQEIFERENR